MIILREEGSCFVSEQVVKYEFEEGKIGLLKIIDPITNRLMSSSCHEYNNIKGQFIKIFCELNEWNNQL